MCRSYSDLNFGVTFLEHRVYYKMQSHRTTAGFISLMECPVLLSSIILAGMLGNKDDNLSRRLFVTNGALRA